MWLKWLPWRFVLRNAAKKHGFLDPLEIMSKLQNFAQPAEVAAPVELLRAGVVFHARGLINSQAIQHNLDWIWPYWVECQFNPADPAFVPRAFSITHVNLTHRNWTAVGLPDTEEWPIVDPRGLVTPFHDGWSIDVWIIPEEGNPLFPSKCNKAEQKLSLKNNLSVLTQINNERTSLETNVENIIKNDQLLCSLRINVESVSKGWVAVVIRPYNPEGISFIHEIEQLKNNNGWVINQQKEVTFDQIPEHYLISSYKKGDVYRFIKEKQFKSSELRQKGVKCKVGMATAAALFPLEANVLKTINFTIPLKKQIHLQDNYKWSYALDSVCKLKVPDEKVQYLYDAALRTLVLHSPKEVYPGPYTYRRFWFRDAALILYAMLCAGFKKRVKRVLDIFPDKQTPFGHFLSQDGEWDSNGEALWIMNQYCELTGAAPDPEWRSSIIKGTKWILRKRHSSSLKSPHAGLLPAGFSAEHLGPNDYYYWDDFWGAAGLKASSSLMNKFDEKEYSRRYDIEANEFMSCIDRSLEHTEKNINRLAIPASPYRRMDAGAIGSIVGGYPLQLLDNDDPRLLDTVNFLYDNCLVKGGFFQDMTHSGINPYLTLHMAQVFLRAGDPRYFELIQAVADLATSTGQWPEAIHPQTKGGCMGDGQHVWAAAEWVTMIRNCFVREEGRKIILCSGVPLQWTDLNETINFGPTLTSHGEISVELICNPGTVAVSWKGQWRQKPPVIEVHLPGYRKRKPEINKTSLEFTKKDLV